MNFTPHYTATRNACVISQSAPRITALHTIFRDTFQPDYTFHGEVHNFWELVCVLDGEVYITANDEVFTLKKGQAILHAPMQFHTIGSAGGTAPTVQVVTFSGENIPAIHDRVCRVHDLTRVRSLYDLAMRTFRIEQIWVWEPLDQSGRAMRFARELEALLLLFADHTQDRCTLDNRRAEQYSLAVKVMEDNLHRRLTVEELAEQCGISRVGLQKTFTKYAGMGVMEYYTRLRMQRASRLLAEGTNVRDTAAAVGFTDQNYFSTAYKRIMGNPPSQNRKKK